MLSGSGDPILFFLKICFTKIHQTTFFSFLERMLFGILMLGAVMDVSAWHFDRASLASTFILTMCPRPLRYVFNFFLSFPPLSGDSVHADSTGRANLCTDEQIASHAKSASYFTASNPMQPYFRFAHRPCHSCSLE